MGGFRNGRLWHGLCSNFVDNDFSKVQKNIFKGYCAKPGLLGLKLLLFSVNFWALAFTKLNLNRIDLEICYQVALTITFDM